MPVRLGPGMADGQVRSGRRVAELTTAEPSPKSVPEMPASRPSVGAVHYAARRGSELTVAACRSGHLPAPPSSACCRWPGSDRRRLGTWPNGVLRTSTRLAAPG